MAFYAHPMVGPRTTAEDPDEAGGTLVLDFDGTVCLGDDLIWAYADGALSHIDPDLAGRLRAEIDAYLRGDPQAPPYPDAYVAVADVIGPHVTRNVLDEAYAASRTKLNEDALDLHAPDGLAELLQVVRTRVRVVVATNSPSTGLRHTLDRLGLGAHVDQLIPSAGKPAAFRGLLASMVHGGDAATVMSVGDVWENDIEPAWDLGCATAFIDRDGRGKRPSHVYGRTIQEIYPAIEAWSRAPHAFMATHQPGGALHA